MRLGSQEVPRRAIAWAHVLFLGIVLTVLNAVKPVHADDAVYLRYGAEFAAHPLNPYGFEYGSPYALPANHILAPPLVEYWLGAGTSLIGDNPVLLKLWLLPFALLLAWAVDSLAQRFAPSLHRPLLWLMVLSPSVLPAFNCMLDVPVLAVGLAALALAIHAVDRECWVLTVLAGLLAGLAVQTKYTGVVPIAAIFAYCLIRGRVRRGLVAVGFALTVAVGWECFVALTQGESHFLVHLHQRQGSFLSRLPRLVLPLLTQVAGLGSAIALLGFVGMGWSGRKVLFVGLATAACFVGLALLPSQQALFSGKDGKPILTPSNLIYGVLALVVWSGVAGACLQLVQRSRYQPGEERRLDWFLLLWLGLEIGGYFALSPFPAARRVAGPLVVLALVAGRLACLRGITQRPVIGIAFYGAALALLIFVADLYDTQSGKTAAPLVAHSSHQPPTGCTYWYFSWMGFGYYAERAGLQPLQINRHIPKPGDLIAVDNLTWEEVLQLPKIGLELVETYESRDRFPLRATPGYGRGRTPLEHRSGPRLQVLIYKVLSVSE
jgi:hypothetical protein